MMNVFKNVVLQREYKSLVGLSINLEIGKLGGFSIEVETNNPIAYESYLYQGRLAESDRDQDFKMLKEMFKKVTN
jgi:hypothetical protein